MATLAERASQQDNFDFILFPGQDLSFTDMFAHPQQKQADSQYASMDDFYSNMTMTTYDSYPTMPAVTSQQYWETSQYANDASMSSQYRTAPSESPSTAASHFDLTPSNSTASVPSATSSATGSPYSGHNQIIPGHESWGADQTLGYGPSIVGVDSTFGLDYVSAGLQNEALFTTDKLPNGYVDPQLISPTQYTPFSEMTTIQQSPQIHAYAPPSPAPSQSSGVSRHVRGGSRSPYLQAERYDPYRFPPDRRPSVSSQNSHLSTHSQGSPRSVEYDEEKGRCPIAECGKVFKDLKAHMLTHQNERPEKCPIFTCDYHLKGFARKYDKNRHTLTHYKGTMVCGFCPHSGSAAEKSFNRADVFKRHLTSVHGVEQTAPNSRKKTGINNGTIKKFSGYPQDATGKCSTCSGTFANAQDFYEHLDDCVLRVVQQEEPSEAINHAHLADIKDDAAVKDTMERNSLPTDDVKAENYDEEGEDEEDEDAEDVSDESFVPGKAGRKAGAKNPLGATSSKITKSTGPRGPGLTRSKGGVSLGKGRKKRKNFPISWGCPADKMKMKKRVLCVYDGPRRLWKDDMMLDNEFEVRLQLGDGKSYVTDLDVKTIERANAFHNATEEEKGNWIPEDDYDLEKFMSASA